jgi:hypothetical protein
MTVPPKLQEIINQPKRPDAVHPDVVQLGATKKDEQWVLLALVRKGATIPIKEVKDLAGEFPVVYQEQPDSLQVARPAFPSKGE